MEEIRPVTVRVRYAPLAISHLTTIDTYIAERNPAAVQDVLARIKHSIAVLRDFPEMGRRGVRRGTRELRVPNLPYIVVHRFDRNQDTLVIIGIYHTAQRRPGQRL